MQSRLGKTCGHPILWLRALCFGWVRSSSALSRQPQLAGHDDEVGQRQRFHLAHQVAAVDFYGDLARSDFTRDLLLRRPATIKPMTACSRGVNEANRR